MEPCCIRKVHISIGNIDRFLDRIREIAFQRATHIILFDACRMAGVEHVQSSLFHAFRALDGGSMISSRVEMEALLYASGSRQIVHGMAFGVHEGENAAYLCICPPERQALTDVMAFCTPADDEDWESLSPEKAALLCELFSITRQEVGVVGPARIRELVLERVALLEVYR